jgi:hypothetical protein
MPLLNLGLVTQTFLTLLDRYVTSSPEWNPANILDASPLPPDKLSGNHTLGFYLYHVIEDPAIKNPPALADVDHPDLLQPMGLQLFYVLTAHSDLEGGNATLTEQLMFGLGVKALRDFTWVREDTVVAGATLFPPALLGKQNQFRITLQPPNPEEAVHYWTAGSQPLRLSAYYQVRPVFLEPEPQTVRAGRVAVYGIYTFLHGRPRLDSSRSVVSFQVPGETSPREAEARPAEAPLGGQVIFSGTDLTGDRVELLVQHVSWKAPETVDPLQWGISSTGTLLLATIGDFAGSQPVLPGIYLASAKITELRTAPDGSTRSFTAVSNQTPFAVTPRIDGPVTFAGGLGTATGANFDPSILAGDDIQLFAGTERLERVGGAPAAGQFQVVDGGTIQFRLPAATASGTVVPFRVLIRGAESAPLWVTAP